MLVETQDNFEQRLAQIYNEYNVTVALTQWLASQLAYYSMLSKITVVCVRRTLRQAIINLYRKES